MSETVESQGQTFTCARIEPYVKADGTKSRVAVWLGHCAECGAEFEQRQPADKPVRWFSRRCEDHKKPGIPVMEVHHG